MNYEKESAWMVKTSRRVLFPSKSISSILLEEIALLMKKRCCSGSGSVAPNLPDQPIKPDGPRMITRTRMEDR